MNRRGFLAGFASLVGGIALDAAISGNRVWSFPKVIKPYNVKPSSEQLLVFKEVHSASARLQLLKSNVRDLGVTDTRGKPLLCVRDNPGLGQYCVNNGIYTFPCNDISDVLISYTCDMPEGFTLTVIS